MGNTRVVPELCKPKSSSLPCRNHGPLGSFLVTPPCHYCPWLTHLSFHKPPLHLPCLCSRWACCLVSCLFPLPGELCPGPVPVVTSFKVSRSAARTQPCHHRRPVAAAYSPLYTPSLPTPGFHRSGSQGLGQSRHVGNVNCVKRSRWLISFSFRQNPLLPKLSFKGPTQLGWFPFSASCLEVRTEPRYPLHTHDVCL